MQEDSQMGAKTFNTASTKRQAAKAHATHLSGGLETQTNSLVVPLGFTLASLTVQEDGGLFLEGLLVLFFGGRTSFKQYKCEWLVHAQAIRQLSFPGEGRQGAQTLMLCLCTSPGVLKPRPTLRT